MRLASTYNNQNALSDCRGVPWSRIGGLTCLMVTFKQNAGLKRIEGDLDYDAAEVAAATAASGALILIVTA